MAREAAATIIVYGDVRPHVAGEMRQAALVPGILKGRFERLEQTSGLF